MQELGDSARRDAWATIRGFLYQIRSTVLRWIDLEADTTLVCESGEDIAHIRKALDPATGKEIEQHVLEQIKIRGRHVTTRSPEILQALANLFRYRSNATDASSLRLRFTTTAVPGREQGIRFPRDLSGIEACQRLSSGLADGTETAVTLDAFRSVVKASEYTPGSKEQSNVYSSFKEFVFNASDENLLDFLRGVEWAVGQPELDVLREHIETRLVSKGLASPAAAPRVSDRLTVFVLERLSQPGPKVLDRPLLLESVVQLDLSSAQQSLLEGLQKVEERLALHLERIERTVHGIDATLNELRAPILRTDERVAQIAEALRAFGMTGEHLTVQAVIPPPDEPPRPPLYHVTRKDLLQRLSADRSEMTWLHLYAGAGMGKSHLARDLSELLFSERSLWISLPVASHAGQAIRHLAGQFCAALVRVSEDDSWWHAYASGRVAERYVIEAAVRILGSNAIVTIDDIPDWTSDARLREKLVGCAEACARYGGLLITIGRRQVPAQAVVSLPTNALRQIRVPPMNTADILGMLSHAGAGAWLRTKGFAEMLEAATRGHPSLVASAVRWLKARDWQVDEVGLTAILTGAATADEQETAARQMVALVPSDAQREMLYRLSLIGHSFTREAADVVAAVPPSLPLPGELLNELLGPWINRVGTDRFEVSPLLATAGRTSLLQGTQHGIHSSLAEHFLRQETLTIEQGLQVLVHLSASGQPFRFATVLISLLNSARTSEDAKQLEILRFVASDHWLQQIPLGLRLMISGLQVKVARLAGEDPGRLEHELDALVESAGDRADEASAAVFALMISGPLREGTPPAVAVRRAIRAFRIIRRHPELLPPATVASIADVIWLPARGVRGVSDAISVADELATLSQEELKAVFESDIALEASEIIANKTWVDMDSRPQGDQDWDLVLAAIQKFDDLARQRGIESLKSIALRAKAITLSDCLGRSEEALALMTGEPEPSNPDMLFLHRYTVARILDDRGEGERCLSEYERALSAEGEEFTFYRFSAYANAAEVAGRLGDWKRSVGLAKAGLRYAHVLATHIPHEMRDWDVRDDASLGS